MTDNSNQAVVQGTAEGNGPIDAIYKAIDQGVNLELELIDYKINSVTKGKDSIGEVYVKVKNGDSLYQGRAMNVDIINASANAYVDAINRYLNIKEKQQVNVQ
ncbi:MAG: hypothetical protein LOD92_07070 [Bacillales bacterium]